MTEQLDTSAAAIAALLERVDEWWDYDHGNIFKDVANLVPALSAQLTAETARADVAEAERDAALARVEVLEAAAIEARDCAHSMAHSEFDGVWDDIDFAELTPLADAALAKGETL